MDINQLLKTKKKVTYKVMVFRYIFLFASVVLLAFAIYAIYDYHQGTKESARRQAQNTAVRIVSLNDERLTNLRQYYVTMAENDSIQWMLDNSIEYSNYSNYKAAYDDMCSKGIFGDYIGNFTFANFKTGWVLSNKGMFPSYETYNWDTLVGIYEEKNEIAKKSYWSYDDGVQLKSSVDRKYRVTVENNGLNFIMHLPFSSYNTFAVFIANIDMDTWRGWLHEGLGESEKIAVISREGEVIYASDDDIRAEGLALLQKDEIEGFTKIDTNRYAIYGSDSEILGWRYYIFSEIGGGQAKMKFPNTILFVMFLLIALCFYITSHLIYLPINALMKDVAGGDGERKSIDGNELEYLAGSYQNLKQDKQALEGLVYQQQDKLQELFELRLIHGEVSTEEWDEYLDGFKLRSWKYFATAVVILNLRDEEVQSMVNEDVICLKLLQELPEEIKKKAWMPPIYNASAIFAIFAEDDEDALLQKIRKFYIEMQEYAKKMCDYNILMGVSATHTKYHHVRNAYRESIHALTINKEMIISSQEQKENENQESIMPDCRFYLTRNDSVGSHYEYKFEEEIRAAIKSVDKMRCYDITDSFSRYLSHTQESNETLLIYTLRYVNTILLTAVEADMNLSELYPDGLKKIYRELWEVIEPDRIRRYIKWKFIDPVILKRTEYMEQHTYSMIEEIEKLIADRCGNISLTECADTLGVHQTYIWKVLKMERGKAFSDYVEEYKLEEAKRLLLETKLTVAEIADKLNYTNAQNFIRFFSKSTGVTPGKFRKLY